MEQQPNKPYILVTGATGYIGGRLVPRLLELGYRVRVAARSVKKLQARPWASHPHVDMVYLDVLKAETLSSAVAGCDVAYYLIHSMNPDTDDFSNVDNEAAQNFCMACEQANLQRIIYLSGLGEEGPHLSKHLASRRAVGRVLQAGSVPVTILQAAMIIGSGSASFEILRYLVERLPVMATPKWVFTATQPIAIRNVLNYLIGCLTCPETTGQVFDIGGPDVLNYRTLMDQYADEAGLPRRWIIPIPLFTPTLSSYWLHLVTPVHQSLARPLAEGLKNKTVCQESRIQGLLPQELLTCKEAIRLALQRHLSEAVETRWTDAGQLPPPETIYPGDPDWAGGNVFVDSRHVDVEAAPSEVWKRIIRIGGENGWYYGDVLWQLRGILDLWFGGVGLRRGRRHPNKVYVGDTIDFWRVVEVEPDKRLFLKAEMRLPGEAYLEFSLSDGPNNTIRVSQIARFLPKGLLGLLYWYGVTPLHHFVFNGMLNGITQPWQIPQS